MMSISKVTDIRVYGQDWQVLYSLETNEWVKREGFCDSTNAADHFGEVWETGAGRITIRLSETLAKYGIDPGADDFSGSPLSTALNVAADEQNDAVKSRMEEIALLLDNDEPMYSLAWKLWRKHMKGA